MKVNDTILVRDSENKEWQEAVFIGITATDKFMCWSDNRIGALTWKYAKEILPLHPLINPDSNHYSRDGELTTIEKMEQKYTLNQMKSWSRINVFKYEDRKDFKGQKESDLKKIETYKNYINLLNECMAEVDSTLTVKEAFEILDIKLRYR